MDNKNTLTILCSSLQKDGVGDYCITLQKSLAESCFAAQVETCNDFINQKKNDTSVLSWQIVPYSYQNKGFMWPAAKKICREVEKYPLHIMFHELWIGGIKESPLKNKFIGFFQKYGIEKVVKETKPSLITTSNTFYQAGLASIGIEAELLPIFSNIPSGNKAGTALYQQLPAEVLNNRHDYVIGIFFGTMHIRPDLTHQILVLNNLIKRLSKKILIIHIGKCNHAVGLFTDLAKQTNIPVTLFGIQDAQEIADLFQHADIGLSTYPKILFEKSGSIAAMLNNNLPVILLDKGFLPDERQFDFVKEVNEIQNLETFISQKKDFAYRFGVKHISEKYRTLLSSKFNI